MNDETLTSRTERGSPSAPHAVGSRSRGTQPAPGGRAWWLRENWRRWLTWLALASVVMAVAALGFAGAWSASVPADVSTAMIWAWGVTAAVRYLIAAVLIWLNATTNAPGWLAIVYVVGLVGTGIIEFALFTIALAIEGAGGWVLALWLVGTGAGTVLTGVGLIWPGMLALAQHGEQRAARM